MYPQMSAGGGAAAAASRPRPHLAPRAGASPRRRRPRRHRRALGDAAQSVRGLQLHPAAIDALDLPFAAKEARIDLVELRWPWWPLLWGGRIALNVQGVHLIVTKRSFPVHKKAGVLDRQLLARRQRQQAAQLAAVDAILWGEATSTPSFAKRATTALVKPLVMLLAQPAVKALQLAVKSLSFRFDIDAASKGEPYAGLLLSMDSLQLLQAKDADAAAHPSILLCKEIRLKGLNLEIVHSGQPQAGGDDHDGRATREAIVKRWSLSISEARRLAGLRASASLSVGALIISANETVMECLVETLHHIRLFTKFKQFRQPRPQLTVLESPAAWWRHAISAVLRAHREANPGRPVRPVRLAEFRQLRELYSSAYAHYHLSPQQLSREERTLMEEVETLVGTKLTALIRWRVVAEMRRADWSRCWQAGRFDAYLKEITSLLDDVDLVLQGVKTAAKEAAAPVENHLQLACPRISLLLSTSESLEWGGEVSMKQIAASVQAGKAGVRLECGIRAMLIKDSQASPHPHGPAQGDQTGAPSRSGQYLFVSVVLQMPSKTAALDTLPSLTCRIAATDIVFLPIWTSRLLLLLDSLALTGRSERGEAGRKQGEGTEWMPDLRRQQRRFFRGQQQMQGPAEAAALLHRKVVVRNKARRSLKLEVVSGTIRLVVPCHGMAGQSSEESPIQEGIEAAGGGSEPGSHSLLVIIDELSLQTERPVSQKLAPSTREDTAWIMKYHSHSTAPLRFQKLYCQLTLEACLARTPDFSDRVPILQKLEVFVALILCAQPASLTVTKVNARPLDHKLLHLSLNFSPILLLVSPIAAAEVARLKQSLTDIGKSHGQRAARNVAKPSGKRSGGGGLVWLFKVQVPAVAVKVLQWRPKLHSRICGCDSCDDNNEICWLDRERPLYLFQLRLLNVVVKKLGEGLEVLVGLGGLIAADLQLKLDLPESYIISPLLDYEGDKLHRLQRVVKKWREATAATTGRPSRDAASGMTSSVCQINTRVLTQPMQPTIVDVHITTIPVCCHLESMVDLLHCFSKLKRVVSKVATSFNAVKSTSSQVESTQVQKPAELGTQSASDGPDGPLWRIGQPGLTDLSKSFSFFKVPIAEPEQPQDTSVEDVQFEVLRTDAASQLRSRPASTSGDPAAQLFQKHAGSRETGLAAKGLQLNLWLAALELRVGTLDHAFMKLTAGGVRTTLSTGGTAEQHKDGGNSLRSKDGEANGKGVEEDGRGLFLVNTLKVEDLCFKDKKYRYIVSPQGSLPSVTVQISTRHEQWVSSLHPLPQMKIWVESNQLRLVVILRFIKDIIFLIARLKELRSRGGNKEKPPPKKVSFEGPLKKYSLLIYITLCDLTAMMARHSWEEERYEIRARKLACTIPSVPSVQLAEYYCRQLGQIPSEHTQFAMPPDFWRPFQHTPGTRPTIAIHMMDYCFYYVSPEGVDRPCTTGSSDVSAIIQVHPFRLRVLWTEFVCIFGEIQYALLMGLIFDQSEEPGSYAGPERGFNPYVGQVQGGLLSDVVPDTDLIGMQASWELRFEVVNANIKVEMPPKLLPHFGRGEPLSTVTIQKLKVTVGSYWPPPPTSRFLELIVSGRAVAITDDRFQTITLVPLEIVRCPHHVKIGSRDAEKLGADQLCTADDNTFVLQYAIKKNHTHAMEITLLRCSKIWSYFFHFGYVRAIIDTFAGYFLKPLCAFGPRSLDPDSFFFINVILQDSEAFLPIPDPAIAAEGKLWNLETDEEHDEVWRFVYEVGVWSSALNTYFLNIRDQSIRLRSKTMRVSYSWGGDRRSKLRVDMVGSRACQIHQVEAFALRDFLGPMDASFQMDVHVPKRGNSRSTKFLFDCSVQSPDKPRGCLPIYFVFSHITLVKAAVEVLFLRLREKADKDTRSLQTRPFLPSALAISVNLNKLALALVDDRLGTPATILEVIAETLSFSWQHEKATEAKLPSQLAELNLFLSALYLNDNIEMMDPVIERWPAKVSLSSEAGRYHFVTESKQLLAIIFTPTQLRAYGDALGFFQLLLKGLQWEQKTNAPEATEGSGIEATPSGLASMGSEASWLGEAKEEPLVRDDTSLQAVNVAAEQVSVKESLNLMTDDLRKMARYRLQNQTGHKLYYWAEEGVKTQAYSVDPGQECVLQVQPVERVITLFDSRKIVARTICLQPQKGWAPVSDVVVDKVGKYVMELQSPQGGANVPLVVDVILEERTKKVVVHSTLQLTNCSTHSLSFSLNLPSSPPAAIGPLVAGESLYLPIQALLGGKLYLQAQGYAKGEKDVISLSSSGLLEQQGLLACASLQADSPPFFCCLQIISDPATRAASGGAIEEHSLSFHAPLVISNALPFPMEVVLHSIEGNSRDPLHIASGKDVHVHNVSLDHHLEATIDVQAFKSNAVHLHHPPKKVLQDRIGSTLVSELPGFRLPRDCTLTSAVGDQKLLLGIDNQASKRSRQRRISLFSPYWIINETGLTLFLKSWSSSVPPIPCPPDEGGALQPVLFSASNTFGSHTALKVASSDWSKSIPLDTVGIKGAVHTTTRLMKKSQQTQVSKRYEFGVEISLAPSPFHRTKVVTITPRFVLKNRTGMPLLFKQVSAQVEQVLANEATVAYHWDSDKGEESLCIKPTDGDSWDWSGAFDIDKAGELGLRTHNKQTGGMRIIVVDVSPNGPSALVTFTASSSKGKRAPYRQLLLRSKICLLRKWLLLLLSELYYRDSGRPGSGAARLVNRCAKLEIFFYQKHVEQNKQHLGPKTVAPYAWDKPKLPHLIVVELPEFGISQEYSVDDLKPRQPILLQQQQSSFFEGLMAPKLGREVLGKVYVHIQADRATRVLSFSDDEIKSFRESEDEYKEQVWKQIKFLEEKSARLQPLVEAHLGMDSSTLDAAPAASQPALSDASSFGDPALQSDPKAEQALSIVATRARQALGAEDPDPLPAPVLLNSASGPETASEEPEVDIVAHPEMFVPSFRGLRPVPEGEEETGHGQEVAHIVKEPSDGLPSSAELNIPDAPVGTGGEMTGKRESRKISAAITAKSKTLSSLLLHSGGGSSAKARGGADDGPKGVLTRNAVEGSSESVAETDEEVRLPLHDVAKETGLVGQLSRLGGDLQVSVVGGQKLAKKEDGCSPYAVVEVTGQLKRTTVRRKTASPEWHEELSFKSVPTNTDVKVAVYDHELLGRDSFLGEVVIALSDGGLDRSAEWYVLGRRGAQDRVSGSIALAFSWTTTKIDLLSQMLKSRQVDLEQLEELLAIQREREMQQQRQTSHSEASSSTVTEEHQSLLSPPPYRQQFGQLEVKVVEARHLPVPTTWRLSMHMRNAYATISCEDKPTQKTRVASSSFFPVWNETFFILGVTSSSTLKIELFDHLSVGADEFLGEVILPISALEEGFPQYFWLRLHQHDSKDPLPGEVRLRLHWQHDNSSINKPHGLVAELNMEGISLSVVDNLPREMLHIVFSGLCVNYHRTVHEAGTKITVQSLQVDNQLLTTQVPVVFCRAVKEDRSWQELRHKKTEEQPMILLAWERMKHNPTILYFKSFQLMLQEADLHLEEDFVDSLVNYFSSLPKSDLWQQHYHKTNEADMANYASTYAVPLEQWVAGKQVVRWYFERLHIQPVRINVTFVTVDVRREVQVAGSEVWHLRQVAASAGFPLVTLVSVPLRLNSLVIDNAFQNSDMLVRSVGRHYILQALQEIHKILGSVDFLGDPMSLVHSLGTGVMDFFVEPAKATTPEEFLKGSVAGSISLIKNSTYGVLNTVSKLTGGVSKGLALLSFDDDYVQRFSQRPADAQETLIRGAQDLGAGFYEGITGLVTNPVAGLEHGGTVGCVKGVGKGMAGLVVKPASGIFEFTSKTTGGIGSGIQALGDDVVRAPRQRSRAPRTFGQESGLEMASQQLEQLKGVLDQLDHGKYRDEKIVDFLQTKSNKAVMLTSSRILYYSTVQQHLRWQIPFSDIASIVAMEGRLEVIIMSSHALGVRGVHLSVKVPRRSTIKCSTRNLHQSLLVKLNKYCPTPIAVSNLQGVKDTVSEASVKTTTGRLMASIPGVTQLKSMMQHKKGGKKPQPASPPLSSVQAEDDAASRLSIATTAAAESLISTSHTELLPVLDEATSNGGAKADGSAQRNQSPEAASADVLYREVMQELAAIQAVARAPPSNMQPAMMSVKILCNSLLERLEGQADKGSAVNPIDGVVALLQSIESVAEQSAREPSDRAAASLDAIAALCRQAMQHAQAGLGAKADSAA
eukprot:SM000006S19501  [mRNA]  locus=s6:1093208:1119415:+ [translate_table: standard]